MARLKVVVLSVCMLFFGTINTLTTKFQDLAVVDHTPDGKPLTFNHPAVQSAFMFFGEMLCLLPFLFLEWRYSGAKSRVRRRAELQRLGSAFRLRRVVIFAIPAACDAVATTLLNVGLFYTFASTYQMLRGTLVLFAGFFTIVILRRTLYIHHWLGMVLITGGAALVGAASVLSGSTTAPGGRHPGGGGGGGGGGGHSNGTHTWGGGGVAGGLLGSSSSWGLGSGAGGGVVLGARRLVGLILGSEPGVDAASAPLFGDLCVVAAQAFTALQFILEEKFVAQYRVPTLLAVGLEGLWGTTLCAVALPVLALVRTGPYHRPVDSAVQAAREIASNGPLAVSVLVTVLSIGSFNFFGISVTKALSGAARATIDATRTLFVMLASMWLGWERFLPLQVVGFAVLFAGTSLYNELIRICLPRSEELAAEVEEEAAAVGDGEDLSYSECSGFDSGDESAGVGRRRRGPATATGKLVDPETGALTEPLLPGFAGSTTTTSAAAIIAASGAGGRGGAAGFGALLGGAPAGEGPRTRTGPHHHHHPTQHEAVPGVGAGEGVVVGGPRQSTTRRVWGPAAEISDVCEYTMARSMRLGHSTLLPHALDADTDDGATESEGGLTGYSPGMSFGSGHTGGVLSQPHIPEGDEGDLVGAMSGVELYDGRSGDGEDGGESSGGGGGIGGRGGGGGGGGGSRVSISIGPHGMLSGGGGRGAATSGRR